ncbi:MAG: hypothetical protein Q8Q52_05755 [Acidimicrobiia bacterium]|nr:hypothetical protein [Acidimicrobiia bacterium]
MSAEHKAALVKGRAEAKAITSYLDALSARRPGRPVTKDSLEKRRARLNERLAAEENTLKRVDLHQSRIEVEEALAIAQESLDLTNLESEFAKVAADYSQRKGISYSAWRSAGVPAAVLKKAGIARTRRG